MVPVPTSATCPEGARRLSVRVAAAVLALLLATPLFATVWTRSNVVIRIPKGGRVDLENASYAARDWSVALTALEVREEGRTAEGNVTTVWVFHYTNTDKQPHYASVRVQCLDLKRNERSRFDATLTLDADSPTGATVEIKAKLQESNWSASALARVVVDFLSTKEG